MSKTMAEVEAYHKGALDMLDSMKPSWDGLIQSYKQHGDCIALDALQEYMDEAYKSLTNAVKRTRTLLFAEAVDGPSPDATPEG